MADVDPVPNEYGRWTRTPDAAFPPGHGHCGAVDGIPLFFRSTCTALCRLFLRKRDPRFTVRASLRIWSKSWVRLRHRRPKPFQNPRQYSLAAQPPGSALLSMSNGPSFIR